MIMKKFIWCVAVCAAMFTSCLSDVESFEPQVESEGFKASFEEMSSRAYLDEDDYCRWELGDAASVFMQNDLNSKFESTQGDVVITNLALAETPSGSASLALADNYAIFPYMKENSIDKDGVLYSMLPAEQTYDASKVAMNNAIMVSKCAVDQKLFGFKNSCALIKFYVKKYSATVPAVKVNKIDVLSFANNLAGKVSIPTANDNYTAKVIENGSKAISLTGCDAAGEISHEEFTEFVMAIPAGTYAAQDLTVSIDTDVEELDYVVTIPKKYVLPRSKYVELKVVLGGKSVEILDDVEAKDRAIMCDVPKVLAQNFDISAEIEYDYEVPVGDFVINGNGKTYNFVSTQKDKYIFTTFTTHQSGIIGVTPPRVTVNQLNITGELRTTCMGVYHKATKEQGLFDTEWNNVNVLNNKILPYTDSSIKRIGSAVCVYGKAVLNDCNVYGTELSGSDFAKSLPQYESWSDMPIYDMACTNSSSTYIHGGKIGKMYAWEQAKIYVQDDAEVTEIYSTAIDAGSLGLIFIDNASVTTLYYLPANNATEHGLNADCSSVSKQYNPRLQITANAKIGVLEFQDRYIVSSETKENLFDAAYWANVKINPNAQIDKVIVGTEEMTLEDFIDKYSIQSI